MGRLGILPGIVIAANLTHGLHTDAVDLPAAKDNTILSESDALSNGSGHHFFAGRNGDGYLRRGLVAFDLGVVPAGSSITDVTLTLYMSRTIVPFRTVDLHRLTADWGEGASDAPGEEGGGDSAAAGDATWLYRTYDVDDPELSPPWATPGGDYDATPSASTGVGRVDPYSWSSPQMVSDVQGWLDDPPSNFGWILINETDAGLTTKRFDSRENGTIAQRPVLSITFTPPNDCVEDVDGSGAVDVDDLVAVILAWGTNAPDADVDASGVVDVDDLVAVVLAWGDC